MCFAGGGETKACSRSITRPRGGGSSSRSSSRMRKKACQLLARSNAMLLVVNFAFVFAFVLASFQNAKPDRKAQPPDENAKG